MAAFYTHFILGTRYWKIAPLLISLKPCPQSKLVWCAASQGTNLLWGKLVCYNIPYGYYYSAVKVHGHGLTYYQFKAQHAMLTHTPGLSLYCSCVDMGWNCVASWCAVHSHPGLLCSNSLCRWALSDLPKFPDEFCGRVEDKLRSACLPCVINTRSSFLLKAF